MDHKSGAIAPPVDKDTPWENVCAECHQAIAERKRAINLRRQLAWHMRCLPPEVRKSLEAEPEEHSAPM